MIEVTILDKDIKEYLDIVDDLRNNGYLPGTDFDFAYYPPKFDNFSNEGVYNRCVVYTFYNDELATWFTLRYK